MLNISTANLVLAVLSAAILVLLIWIVLLSLAFRRQVRTRRQVVVALKGENDIIEVISKSLDDIERLFARHDELASAVEKDRAILAEAIRHVGVVRYDAFADVGGGLSFSVALLDESGDGAVITSINGRSDSHVYAKQVAAWRSDHSLSDEEEKAITEAQKGVKA